MPELCAGCVALALVLLFAGCPLAATGTAALAVGLAWVVANDDPMEERTR